MWMGQDVYRGRLEEPGSLHRFGYVENNPVNGWDWYGFLVIYFTGFGETRESIVGQHSGLTPDKYFKWYDGIGAFFYLKEILKKNPDEPIVIVGHSYGGWAALNFANALNFYLSDAEVTVITLDPAYYGIFLRSSNISEWINVYQKQTMIDSVVDIPAIGVAVGICTATIGGFLENNQLIATGGNQFGYESQADINIEVPIKLDHNNPGGMLLFEVPSKNMLLKDYIESIR